MPIRYRDISTDLIDFVPAAIFALAEDFLDGSNKASAQSEMGRFRAFLMTSPEASWR